VVNVRVGEDGRVQFARFKWELAVAFVEIPPVARKCRNPPVLFCRWIRPGIAIP